MAVFRISSLIVILGVFYLVAADQNNVSHAKYIRLFGWNNLKKSKKTLFCFFVVFFCFFDIYKNTTWLTNFFFQLSNDEDSKFALKDQFPFVVSLSCFSRTNGQPIVCSGSVINDQHILTSASCVTQCGSINIRYNSIDSDTDIGTEVEGNIAYVHPFYNLNANGYDIAIVRTARKALENAPMVRLASVSNFHMEKELMKNSSVIASSWGKLGTNQSQYVQGKLLSSSIVKGKLILRAKFSGSPKEHSYDSGSPLLVKLDGHWVQVGIATSASINNNQFGLFTSLFSNSIHTFIHRALNYI